MKCSNPNHAEVDAGGMCVYCGKPFCSDCLVAVEGKMYCKDDLGKVFNDAKNSSAATPVINITNTNDNVNSNVNAGYGMPPLKSKMTALILCLLGFVGIAGIHRMYVGKVGSGILYLLTGGMCGIGTIIDLIMIISGGFKDSFGHPLA